MERLPEHSQIRALAEKLEEEVTHYVLYHAHGHVLLVTEDKETAEEEHEEFPGSLLVPCICDFPENHIKEDEDPSS